MILVLDPGMEEKQQQELCLKLQKKVVNRRTGRRRLRPRA